MLPVFRIEYPKPTSRTTNLIIAAPLLDSVPEGLMSVLDEVEIRLKNIRVDGMLPLDYFTHDDIPIKWKGSAGGHDVFECGVQTVMGCLRAKDLDPIWESDLAQKLQTLPLEVYRFQYETDYRFIGRGRDQINNQVLSTIMELCARRQPLGDVLSDHCGL